MSTFGVGVGTGRGRGFAKLSSMADSLPRPGAISNVSNGHSNGGKAAFNDDDWDETPSTNSTGWVPSGGNESSWNPGGGGSSWSGGNSSSGGGGRGGGGGNNCFNCGQDGHRSRECPEPKKPREGGGMTCFNCSQTGHQSRDCPEPRKPREGGGGGGTCYNCGESGHQSRDCTEPRKPREGGGGGTCYNCGQSGHMSRECPEPKKPREGGGGTCYNCGQDGHMSRECPEPKKPREGGGPRTCRKCGEDGHMSRECPENGGTGERKIGCFNCGQEGHQSKECTEPASENKPKASTYVPEELGDDQLEQHTSYNTGINFDKQDSIEVKVSGDDAPPPIRSFEDAKFRPHLLGNITYNKPTPVQKYTIPILRAKRDLMACAQTGSGKTAAFLLPIIQTLFEASDLPNTAYSPTQEPWAVIIAPTRELAIQIHTESKKFARNSVVKCEILYGGTSVSVQASRISRGCHILVATPGRLIQFLESGKISFSQLRYFVLDEADRLLDMGFKTEIEKMCRHSSMPPKGERQTLMFSATFPIEVQGLARDFLHNYLFLVVGVVGAANSDVSQRVFQVTQYEKRQKLMDILKEIGVERTLVFIETKRNTDFNASFLSQNHFMATSIHGDREQKEREEALSDFRMGRMPILMATAVAARGLDIKDVRHVINFDLPKTIDEYVHRIGRTGRVGNTGLATSFYDPAADGPIAADLVKILADAQQEVPDWLQQEASMNGGGSFQNSRFGARDMRKGQSSVTSTDGGWGETGQSFGGASAVEEEWD